jgi:predicted permease
MIASILLDLRHALRLYLKTPWQSALAVLTMAVAMTLVGGMSSLWSELHAGGSRGVENDKRLVTFGRLDSEQNNLIGAGPVAEFNRGAQTITQLTGESSFGHIRDVDLRGEPIEGSVAPVLPGYFETLTPRILHGRGLAEQDFAGQGARALVLGHRLWQERFGADPEVVGTEIGLDDHTWRVVGVMDESFGGIGRMPQLFWAPYKRFLLDFHEGLPEQMHETIPFWRLAGRLRDEASVESAEAELSQFIQNMPQKDNPMEAGPGQIVALPGLIGNVDEHFAAQKQVTLMLLAALLIATVATINIGTFLLARIPARNRELALRQTVGASRKRLAGQLLTEASLLVVCGTLAGLVLSLWLAAAMRELSLFERVSFSESLLNAPALAFSLLLAIVLSVIVAAIPLSRLRRQGLIHSARNASSRPGLFQHATGLVQLGLTGLLAAAAVGFLSHLWILDQRDPGLHPEGVLVTTLGFKTPPTGTFQPPPDEAKFSFRAEARERLGSLPGVEEISFGSPVPGQRAYAISTFRIGERSLNARVVNVAPGFFDLLGIEILQGRTFESGSEPGVVVSREFVRQAWGEENVIGRFLRRDQAGAGQADSRIIGVVEDVRYEHPEKPPVPLVFSSAMGFAGFMNAGLVRGDVDEALVKREIDEALTTHLDELKVVSVRPLTEIMAQLTERDRARTRITVLFGAVIVLMSAFGFFAMQRFLVDSGRRETAIHMSLGAGPAAVRRRVLLQGLKLGLPGLVVGSLLGLIGTTWLVDRYLIDDVSPTLVALSVAAGLLGILLLASAQPALAAARLRPGDVLKEE